MCDFPFPYAPIKILERSVDVTAVLSKTSDNNRSADCVGIKFLSFHRCLGRSQYSLNIETRKQQKSYHSLFHLLLADALIVCLHTLLK